MDERYTVYFAGQVMEGHQPDSVRAKLAKVFNADQATLDKLFSGKPQILKRDCDPTTAAKYKQALERAGAVPIIKLVEAAPSAATTAASPEPARPLTAAERIAALAAAPDEDRYRKPVPDTATGPAQAAAAQSSSIVLAPPGTEVLREHERAVPVSRDVDTAGLEVDTAAERLSEEPPPPPAAPDTRHISMGAVGETIPTLPSHSVAVSPNLDGLMLSAPGTDFSDCAAPDQPALPLDLSHLNALPPGDMPAEELERRPMPVATPTTDHLSLED